MISFVCPRCKTGLTQIAPDALRCLQDGLIFNKVSGIWNFLLPERLEFFSRFLRDYETVRRFEGRGSADELYYQILPYYPSSDWKVRAASFNVLVKQVIAPIEKNKSQLQILDLGAGNCWVSNLVASRGHAVAAIDLTINNFDGLGCHRFYKSAFIPVQAEFDYLPFPAGSFDIVLYNAALHYSTGYEQSLRESLRVMGVDGKLVILDSPVYHDPGSGQSMVLERYEQFMKRFGFASDSLQSENYLTYQRMDELALKLGITWCHIRPFYGMRWVLRPLQARLLGRREPAEFGVWVGNH